MEKDLIQPNELQQNYFFRGSRWFVVMHDGANGVQFQRFGEKTNKQKQQQPLQASVIQLEYSWNHIYPLKTE